MLWKTSALLPNPDVSTHPETPAPLPALIVAAATRREVTAEINGYIDLTPDQALAVYVEQDARGGYTLAGYVLANAPADALRACRAGAADRRSEQATPAITSSSAPAQDRQDLVCGETEGANDAPRGPIPSSARCSSRTSSRSVHATGTSSGAQFSYSAGSLASTASNSALCRAMLSRISGVIRPTGAST
jgi:hypothetical protein